MRLRLLKLYLSTVAYIGLFAPTCALERYPEEMDARVALRLCNCKTNHAPVRGRDHLCQSCEIDVQRRRKTAADPINPRAISGRVAGKGTGVVGEVKAATSETLSTPS